MRARTAAGQAGPAQPNPTLSPRYKWIALVNTTTGVLMVTIDGSIVLIALPDVFRGIQLDPLTPGNSFYLLWMILGFLVVTSVLVVSLGRLGDMYGRVKIYNLGFAVFTFFSLVLTITWMTGPAAAIFLIVMRIFQGVGGAMLFANSGGHPDRRLPAQPAGHGAGHQRRGRDQRDIHRAGRRRPAGPDQLAAHLPGLGAHRAVLHGVGLHQAARRGAAPPDLDRLGGQRHLRHRADRGHGGDHLRHRALPAQQHGLDQPGGGRRAHPRGGRC